MDEGALRLMAQLEKYQPWNEQEEQDRQVMLELLAAKKSRVFVRESRTAHITASSWIVNRERNRTLMVYHNIYHSWSWTGGHADGETDLLSVALREAREETGIVHIHPVSEEIFSIETLTVDGHEKRGVYVPSHLHLNVTYLVEADEADSLAVKADENSGVGWFDLDEALKVCTEPWMVERIYRKLNEKLAGLPR